MRRLLVPILVLIGICVLVVPMTIVSVVSAVFLSGAAACSSAPFTANLPQATIDYLAGRNVEELAKQNQERYLYAQEQTGVPWQVMAALHYREAGMNPNSSISNGAPLGSGTNVDGVYVVSNANDDAKNMAEKFKSLALGVYGVEMNNLDEMTTDDWGQAFLAYNRGYLFQRAGVNYTESPYVMNGFDDAHMNMRWTYADTVSGVDGNKAGALTVLAYLGGVALSSAPSSGNCSGTIVAPVKGDNLIVTSGSNMRSRVNNSGTLVYRAHEGIDIIGGSDIVAMSAGTVTVAQNNYSGYGTAVKIDHQNGTYTLYGHMVYDSLDVSVGQNVIAGQRLGTMGNTGDSDGVHLHFQLWINNELVNAFPYLEEHGIKLTWQAGAYPRNETPGPIPHN